MEKDILNEIEYLNADIDASLKLSEVVWEKTDHAEGATCEMTAGEYDRLSALTMILFERLFEESKKLKEIIKKIYKTDKEKENGKV